LFSGGIKTPVLIEVQAQWSDGVPFDFTSLSRAFVV
jgi:hypothetical protein